MRVTLVVMYSSPFFYILETPIRPFSWHPLWVTPWNFPFRVSPLLSTPLVYRI